MKLTVKEKAERKAAKEAEGKKLANRVFRLVKDDLIRLAVFHNEKLDEVVDRLAKDEEKDDVLVAVAELLYRLQKATGTL